MLLIFITCYVKKKKNHEYYSNVLWVINIGMDIDICKNQNKINYSEISYAPNVRQSLLHTYNITNNKNKNGK